MAPNWTRSPTPEDEEAEFRELVSRALDARERQERKRVARIVRQRSASSAPRGGSTPSAPRIRRRRAAKTT
jgi:hypothetical protein